MSEFTDSLKSQFPERCQSCPTMLGLVEIIEISEQAAKNSTQTLAEFIDDPLVERFDVDDPIDVNFLRMEALLNEIQTDIVSMNTESELRYTSDLRDLLSSADGCRGATKTPPSYFPLSMKIEAKVKGQLFCSNGGWKNSSAEEAVESI